MRAAPHCVAVDRIADSRKAILQNFNIDLLKEAKASKGEPVVGQCDYRGRVFGKTVTVLARSDSFRDFPSVALRG